MAVKKEDITPFGSAAFEVVRTVVNLTIQKYTAYRYPVKTCGVAIGRSAECGIDYEFGG